MPTPEVTTARDEIVFPRRTGPLSTSFGARPRVGLRPLSLSLLTGALLWLCYFPVAWGWLAWIALVPLLGLVRSPARRRVIYLSAWCGGLAFCLAAMQWMRVADPRMYFTWIFLAVYCSLYFPLALYLIRFLDRRTPVPLIVSVPVVWIALEFLRSTVGTGFSWYLLGHTQHSLLPLIQIADVTGAYGVSFLVAAVNALLFEILWSRSELRGWIAGPDTSPRWGRLALLAQGLVVLAGLVGSTVYGFQQLGRDDMTPGPRIALIQGNLDQRLRNDTALDRDAAQRVAKHFIELSDLAARFHPELIVWPETSYPDDFVIDSDRTLSEHSRETARRMASRWQTNILVGANAQQLDAGGHPRRYNSAVLIDPKGQYGGRYDKIHRVPFGEYVPLRDWLPWMNYFAPYDFDYSVWPGQEHTRFRLVESASKRQFSFGALICYEDTDAEVARPYSDGYGRAPVDFVLNTSNDGWFDGTSEHDQHLAICRFRAIECRRCVARSVNMGISAVIDANGRVLRPEELPLPEAKFDTEDHVWTVPLRRGQAQELPEAEWHQFKKVPGVLLAVIPVDSRSSFYAVWGDWLPWTCWIVLGAAFAYTIVQRITRSKSGTI